MSWEGIYIFPIGNNQSLHKSPPYNASSTQLTIFLSCKRIFLCTFAHFWIEGFAKVKSNVNVRIIANLPQVRWPPHKYCWISFWIFGISFQFFLFPPNFLEMLSEKRCIRQDYCQSATSAMPPHPIPIVLEPQIAIYIIDSVMASFPIIQLVANVTWCDVVL